MITYLAGAPACIDPASNHIGAQVATARASFVPAAGGVLGRS